MLWVAFIVTFVGLARSQEPTEETGFPPQREWDCSQDHAPHPSNPRMFLQSPNGFGEGAAVTEAICPNKLQVFSQSPEGVCRCLYIQELRDLLDQPCQIRVRPNSEVQMYELLSPSQNVDTIEELYVQQDCNAVLPQNVVQWYFAQGASPLFYNSTRCGCDWNPAALGFPGPPLGEGQRCEVLADLSFSGSTIGSDAVGNWVSVFPHNQQNNFSQSARGGAQFGASAINSAAIWRLAGTDYVEINFVARFESTGGSGQQIVFSNRCRDRGTQGGTIELQYNPSGQRYTLQYFSENAVSCSAGGGGRVQNVQVMYNRSFVSMTVNNQNCDVSALNPTASDNPEGRILLDTACPMQLGGNVFTDPIQTDFGGSNDGGNSLQGDYYQFLTLRNCDNPPRAVQDKIGGIGLPS